MKRVALYARVSGDKQEREETINSQLAQLRTLAAQKNLTVLDRHVYLDDGYSGGLLRVISEIDRGSMPIID